MTQIQVSIGRVKREISELLNRVAFGGDRIVLTSRGKPKAVIVSVADFERLQQQESAGQQNHWQNWLAANEALSQRILAERQGEPLDVAAIWAAGRAELEERDDDIIGR